MPRHKHGMERMLTHGYNAIIADPPHKFNPYPRVWNYGPASDREPYYECRAWQDVLDLPISKMANKGCLLWLWTPTHRMPLTVNLLKYWGFKFVTSGVLLQPFLVGAYDVIKPIYYTVNDMIVKLMNMDVYSQDAAYSIIESMVPKGPYIELFPMNFGSREHQLKWHGWDDTSKDYERYPEEFETMTTELPNEIRTTTK